MYLKNKIELKIKFIEHDLEYYKKVYPRSCSIKKLIYRINYYKNKLKLLSN